MFVARDGLTATLLGTIVKASVVAFLALAINLANADWGNAGTADGQTSLAPLIEPDALDALRQAADVQIVDIRNAEAVRALYSYGAGHIPGAVNVPYGRWRALWHDGTGVPDAARMTEFLRAAGLRREAPVVIVHSSAAQANFGSAAWVYWVLKTAGFEQIAILDGGIRAWMRSGGDLSTDPVDIVPSDTVARIDTRWLATTDDINAVIAGKATGKLLDARPERLVAGSSRLPGSAALSGETLVTGPFATVGDTGSALERLRQAAADWRGGDVIAYCNDGSFAAINWFMASEVAGIENVRIYGQSLNGHQRAGLGLSDG